MGKNGWGWVEEDPRLKRLYDFRKKRTHLHLDKKILLSWNTWAIIAMARAGLILKDSRYTEAALKAQIFIHEKMTDKKNRLFLRCCDGETAGDGQLDDYAGYALALIELYRSTFNSAYLQEAVFRAKQMMDLFEDRKRGGYYLTAHDSEALIMRPKETYDGAIPSGNSVAEATLQELAAFTGEPLFSEAAGRQHRFMAGRAKAHPSAHSFSLAAMAKALYPHKELICASAALPTELLSYLREHPAHNLNILFLSPESKKTLSETAPFTSSYPVSQHTTWYLCENGACHAPQRNFDKLDLTPN